MNKINGINQVLRWDLGDGKEKLERVLWVDEECKLIYLFDLSDIKSIPESANIDDIQTALENGSAEIIDNDPFATYLNDEEIPPKHREIRDNAWDVSLTKGPEEFLKMLEYMQRNYSHLSLNLGIVALPQYKSFSQYDNGGIRPAALVRVEQVGRLPCYIVEIGRADSWSISTLVIKPVDWDKDFFDGEKRYRIEMAKHMSGQTIERWAERVVEKVIDSFPLDKMY